MLWISIAAGLVIAFGAVAAGYAVGAGSSKSEATEASAKPSTRPEPEASAPTVPLPEPSEEPVSVIPAECSGIYTTDWSTQLDGYVLNPAWAAEDRNSATSDDELNAIVKAGDPLRCQWGHESGGSDRSLKTAVVAVTAEQSAAVLARLQVLDFSCYEELGGTRCVLEEDDDNGTWGESHFVRDGVWIATRWMNMAPDGYTHDIVNTLWP
ncbi:hypothetical protein EV379_0400 [Microterricola gilva]|uniref:Uncharacterized protein n=1 Tax=Microterricola gilva TaxID=393267 RepID=A0A4V2GAH0_9MICO|nr:hypothetical protein EV379_0400 [Microterricola gilva]